MIYVILGWERWEFPIIPTLKKYIIAKFLIYKMNTNSIKRKTSKKNSFVLQGGVIGLCLGVGVGTALKDLFSETAILLVGIIGATIGVIIGIVIRHQKEST